MCAQASSAEGRPTGSLANVDLHCGQYFLFTKRTVFHGDRTGCAGSQVRARQVDNVGLLDHADLADVLEQLLLGIA